ncbi:MAG: hypothetical protein EBT86_03485 [Actinobacteria bacterium]|nr:hypothetical protein [Actinomycetota bacterium]
MAIATLNKFTVPLASDSSATTQGMLMPKLKYRFRIMFENFGTSTPTTELTKQVQTAAKPNAQFQNQVIETYNSKINYAGKVTWQTIQVVLRDDQSGNVSRLVGEQMQKQFDFFEQASAAAAADYKFLMRIEITEGGNGAFNPNVLETWECYGCYVTQCNWQSLSYAEAAPQTIDLTIQPDNCIQIPKGTGVGIVVPTQEIRSRLPGNGGIATGTGV